MDEQQEMQDVEAAVNRLALFEAQWLWVQDNIRRLAILCGTSFLAGLIIGLTVMGWWLWPVVWIPSIDSLELEDRVRIVEALADLNAYEVAGPYVIRAANGWGADEVACYRARNEEDVATKARLLSLAWAVNGNDCSQ